MRALTRFRRRPGRRRLITVVLVAVPIAALTLSFAIPQLFPSSDPLAAGFSRVRPGMTRPQVDGLLGGPPGDYGEYTDGLVDGGDGGVLQIFSTPSSGAPMSRVWQDDRNRFFVFFDTRGRVVAASRSKQFRRYPRSGLADGIVGAVRSLFR